MTADVLLSRLDKVKRTGQGRYVANCPAHASKSGSSLAVRELDDGRILLHCFGGCDTSAVLAAVGLTMDVLFPYGGKIHRDHPERRPFPAADVLRCVAFESLVVAMAGNALLTGRPFSEADRARMMLAVSRLQAAPSAAGIRHG